MGRFPISDEGTEVAGSPIQPGATEALLHLDLDVFAQNQPCVRTQKYLEDDLKMNSSWVG